jgi:glycine dehydrogenase
MPPFNSWCFESAIKEITQIIHDNGGLVIWMAQIWMHKLDFVNGNWRWCLSLNLHKTFAIPHGGGDQVLDQFV